MEVILIVACLFIFISYWIGYSVGKNKRAKKQTLGTLQIDHSDPDMPYLFLLDYDLDYIATKKQATFEVKVENIISQN